MYSRTVRRTHLLCLFAAALAFAQFRETGLPELAAHFSLDAGGPARVYLFKDGRRFRLNPVDAVLPLHVDTFYRDRLWRRTQTPRTLEAMYGAESHLLLLEGSAAFDLPAGSYRVEAYRGTLYRPTTAQFTLTAGENRRVELKLEPVPGREEWLAGDDHIHLTREPADNHIFLRWLRAEDLAVGNFLQLQRQMDAAPQYAFGAAGEAALGSYVIRSGHESRSEFYGHVNLLGVRELIRPLSVGSVYANSPEAYPFPAVLFAQGRKLGGTVGYAHFNGSQKNSTLLMDLALGNIDFTEVFQFGVLKTDDWYRLLNAGLRVTGIAGSDFPVPLGRFKEWPLSIPLLGPERTFVRRKAGARVYDTWAAGVRAGEAVVSNGPLLELEVNGRGPGATLDWSGDRTELRVRASARDWRPVESVEIVVNGRVQARSQGGAPVEATLPVTGSSWVAARATSREPGVQAHTNPVYALRRRAPVRVPADLEAVRRMWQEQAAWYKSANLVFAREEQRRELFEQLDRATAALMRE